MRLNDLNSNRLQYGSVCSGIEAATVAWHPLGWQPAWFAEIEPFPCNVLAHHYPNVRNLGDMTKIEAMVRAGDVAAPDVLVGGTPCQAYSVAGLRNGLNDARGQLTISYVKLADAIDTTRSFRGEQPAVIVWENVPGVLSDKTNAFGCFLGGLAGEDCELEPPRDGKGRRKSWPNAGCVYGPKRTIAWRIIDAQYTGVAQRRRRVFVIASARDDFDPTEVLFEFDGLRRDFAPSRETRESTSHAIAPCLTNSGRGVERVGDIRGQDPVVAVAFGGNNTAGPIDVATTRNACSSASGRMDFESETFLVQSLAGTLQANRKAAGNTAQQDAECGVLVPMALSVALRGRDGGATAELGDEIAGCLRASGGGGDKAHVLAPIAFAQNSRDEVRLMNGDGSIVGALSAEPGMKQTCYVALPISVAVRRLTPRECERLQGFPDDYTLIPTARGSSVKPHEMQEWIEYLRAEYPLITREEAKQLAPDGPRYKALGNSMAVTCMRWLGRRIHNALNFAHKREMARVA